MPGCLARAGGTTMDTMTSDAWTGPAAQRSGLLGQTVVIIGGGSGIGLATARRAKTAGARLIVTDRRSGPLEEMADEVGVEATASFDEFDFGRLESFLYGLPGHVDHVVLVGGPPYLAPLDRIDLARTRDALDGLLLPICIARYARREMRDGGSLVFVGEIGARRPNAGRTVAAIVAAAWPALIASLAVEAAPVRVNLIVPTPAGPGDDDVATLAVHLMSSPALTGAILDLGDGPLRAG